MTSYDPDQRRVAIFADSDAGRRDTRAVAERIGARVMFDADPSDGGARLADLISCDAILVDLGGDCGGALDAFLDRLDAFGRAQRVPVLVNSTPECLDAVAVRLEAPTTALMCQATAADWVSALALSGGASGYWLREVATDDSFRLQRLADEVQRIARTLAELAGSEPATVQPVRDAMIGFRAEPPSPATTVGAGDVRAIIRLRRLRDRFFPGELFADPAWDMLLDLTAARLERIQVAVSSLCIAAAVPPTTALRWIKTMTDAGMFARVADPHDGRRIFIALSDQAAAGMMAYLSAARSSGGLAI